MLERSKTGTKALPKPDRRAERTYDRPNLFATNLDELRSICGQHGDAAVNAARWGGLTTWLMNMPVDRVNSGLTHDYAEVLAATHLAREDDWARLGYPDHRGVPRISPMLGLSEEAVARARKVAAQTVEDWERVGSPYISRERIKTVQMYVATCAAQSAKAALPS